MLENIIEVEPMKCFRCKKAIPLAYEAPADNVTMTDNGLLLSFDGGYGEFVDHIGTKAEMLLCHECGHELADFLGLDVHNWHTHHEGSSHEDHDDHAIHKRKWAHVPSKRAYNHSFPEGTDVRFAWDEDGKASFGLHLPDMADGAFIWFASEMVAADFAYEAMGHTPN